MHLVTTSPSLVPTTPTEDRPRPHAGASDRYPLPWECRGWSVNDPPRFFSALLYRCGCSLLPPVAPPARDRRCAAPPPSPSLLGHTWCPVSTIRTRPATLVHRHQSHSPSHLPTTSSSPAPARIPPPSLHPFLPSHPPRTIRPLPMMGGDFGSTWLGASGLSARTPPRPPAAIWACSWVVRGCWAEALQNIDSSGSEVGRA